MLSIEASDTKLQQQSCVCANLGNVTWHDLGNSHASPPGPPVRTPVQGLWQSIPVAVKLQGGSNAAQHQQQAHNVTGGVFGAAVVTHTRCPLVQTKGEYNNQLLLHQLQGASVKPKVCCCWGLQQHWSTDPDGPLTPSGPRQRPLCAATTAVWQLPAVPGSLCPLLQ